MNEKICLADEIYIKEISRHEFEKNEEVIKNRPQNSQKRLTKEEKDFVQRILSECKVSLGEMAIEKTYGIFSRETYIGYVRLVGYTVETPEIQVEIAKEYRGVGIGYKAIKWIVNKTLEEEGVKWLVYRVVVGNEHSLNLIKKLGGVEISTDEIVDQFVKTFHLREKIG